MLLIINMIMNFIEKKPLINPKLFNSLSKEDDFYTILIKFAEDVINLYNNDKEQKNTKILDKDNMKYMNLNANKSKNKENINGYDNEYKNDINESNPSTVVSISIISYPIEPTLFVIISNALKNILKLMIGLPYNNDDENEKLISELDNVLYQQVRSSIPFSSDTEDSDYEDMDDMKTEINDDMMNETELNDSDDSISYEYINGNESEDESESDESNDIFKELFDINYKHFNLDSLKNNIILTRNQSDILKYKNDIHMPIFRNIKSDNIENSSNKNSNSVISNLFKKNGFNNNRYQLMDEDDHEKIKNQFLATELCVACHKRPRSIVLWPCGCFCLCDTCRKVLALQKYDKCPCTNNKVKGYSKVFVP
ncbi:hypothetical protein BCR36DRAFT_317377 [Piromyces finnis]|uniref:RING-type domain-containing protein n=1 Tax=Piromyces finnis TaxID=1754191 RepID=A0A1Y1VLF9_9FUNG|nr:hypothetical protein BCR36DRAFT_317377 [Piromyces finnis]|eukprot:ORX59300.1 hypothetical protein BCR36DRAFT_317377 [Piromyces finnis]